MVQWINRHQRWLQWAIIVVAALMEMQMIYQGWHSGLLARPESRNFKSFAKGLSKPAELAIFAILVLVAVRTRYSKLPASLKNAARTLLRLLQVIHIPLGLVLLGVGAVHGLFFIVLHWEGNLHDWSGVAALAGLLPVALLGWRTTKQRHTKRVHMTWGLVVGALALLHIFVL